MGLNCKQKNVIFWVFIGIFALTAIVSFAGIIAQWFYLSDGEELPFLTAFVSALILEVIGIVVLWGKSAFKPSVEEHVFTTYEAVNDFLLEFFDRGTSIRIVSNNASWITNSIKVQERMNEYSMSGKDIHIFLANPPESFGSLDTSRLSINKIELEGFSPAARFTLLNFGNRGSEVLAIGVGVAPELKVYVVRSSDNPAFVSMAYDIINICQIRRS